MGTFYQSTEKQVITTGETASEGPGEANKKSSFSDVRTMPTKPTALSFQKKPSRQLPQGVSPKEPCLPGGCTTPPSSIQSERVRARSTGQEPRQHLQPCTRRGSDQEDSQAGFSVTRPMENGNFPYGEWWAANTQQRQD